MIKSQNSRRQFLKISGLGIAGLALPLSLSAMNINNEKEYLVYIGTYTKGESKGIYLYKLDVETGALKSVSTTSGVVNPSFLTLDPGRKFLYAVNEVGDFQGKESGAVSAFSIDQKTGALSFLNQQPTSGSSPCYVNVDKTGKVLMVANYGGGNVAIYPIKSNGHIGKSTSVVNHKSGNKGETTNAKAHCIVTDPDNNYVFVPYLGEDKISIYKLNVEKADLSLNNPDSIVTKEGAGPRHFTFHPNGDFAFVINELNSTVTSFNYNKKNGQLKEVHTVSSLPKDFKEKNSCAHILVSPDGGYLYGSNRGHNSIVVYSIDQNSGKITLVEHTSTLGKTPRNFTIDPSGKILLAANQDTNDIFTFFINSKNGKLTATGNKVSLPSPVFLKVVPLFT
ncbi:MAG: beta-propeller fold lactonase family protein [Bacteroidota bacterium]|nr:beta-propeller fold lactonase family protein [Bacteroidota bacterium]